jgi:hypothetical protein
MRDRGALRWAVVGALIQLGLLVAYFHGFAVLVLFPAIIGALLWTVLAARWIFRDRLFGGVLLGVVLGVPAFILGHARYLARVVPTRVADYEAALPIVLEADRLHCKHPLAGSVQTDDWCELQDYLPATVTRLGRVIVVSHSDLGPQVTFILLRGTRWVVMHVPAVEREPPWLCDLGNGWFTSLCRGRKGE